MRSPDSTKSEEAKSLEVAEASRETEWTRPSFMRELFLGRFHLDLLYDGARHEEERPEFRDFFERLKRFLIEEVDPAEIDRTGEYPRQVIQGLTELGCFGMKIPKEYGGLGFSQLEYGRVMTLLGSYDGNLTALLSAHQSIGVPQPLKLFGTEAQKKKYLPLCARGAVSAFALTEPAVGSDPARLTTQAEPSSDGQAFVLNGNKLWCTNGTIADLFVVMARNPETDKISAFIVESAWEGVRVDTRCRFMGLKALANGVVSFHNVRVPRENLIGEEGKGLKIALITLNTGRLTLPAATAGTAKACLEICRKWGNARVQWGRPVGEHEAVAHKLADMTGTAFAMEAVAEISAELADMGNRDIRLEASAAKEYNTTQGWRLVDDTLQIRGGRGFETEASLENRGEAPIGVERLLRDSRINRIFEGSSEIMHLFMAREAVDKHLQVAGALIDPKKTVGAKLAALPGIAAFYAWWYPSRWIGWGLWPKYNTFGVLASHLRFVERSSRKLSRTVFHGMMIYQGKLQRKQAFLFRAVDIAMELFAMAAACVKATRMADAKDAHIREATRAADLFCRDSRRKVRRLFKDMWHTDDDFKYRIGRETLEGRYAWMEKGAVPLGFSQDDLVPAEGGRREPPKAAES
ncbi:MAG: acyl-CoA dehydrogenase family protein [Acidobacteriota bacterium]